ncbi:MAG TPA: NAD(+)/NADH kinase [Solirubrobacteraceae bacterium]
MAPLARLGLVVHPSRDLEPALGAVRRWAQEHGVELVQLRTHADEHELAPAGDVGDVDLVVAVGGDGTVLAGLRLGASADRSVLGVACGSLGALAAVPAEGVTAALDRVAAGECETIALPALEVRPQEGEPVHALNDLVAMRAGSGQLRVAASLDGALYARWAGDGVILATAVGSSAYTLAAGGPVLAPGAGGTVLTALAPHGGCIPPLVAGAEGRWSIDIVPGFAGARIELDGQPSALAGTTFEAVLRPSSARLVRLGGEEPFLAALRRRGIIADSPRVLADDRRPIPRWRG